MERPIEQLLFKRWRNQLWDQVTGPQDLKIGVWTGKNIRYYPEEFELTGIDLSPDMLKEAK